jgi:hypothetical protein
MSSEGDRVLEQPLLNVASLKPSKVGCAEYINWMVCISERQHPYEWED